MEVTEHEKALAIIVASLKEMRQSPAVTGNITLTPSQASLDWCPLQVYHKLIGAPKMSRRTLKTELTFAVGNAIHNTIQKWIKEKLPDTLVECSPEEKNLFGYTARCRIDLCTPPITGTSYVGEIKSCGSANFEKHKKVIPSYHLFQMLMNAYLMEWWAPGLYILVNRDNLEIHVQLVDLCESDWEHEALGLKQLIETNVKLRLPPEKPPGKSKYLCGTCGYYDECYSKKVTSREFAPNMVFRD